MRAFNHKCIGDGKYPHTFDGWDCPICERGKMSFWQAAHLEILYWLNRFLDWWEKR